MKQMKKLTRNQKIILSRLGYNAKEYALVLDSSDVFVIGLKEAPNVQMIIKYVSPTTGRVLNT